MSIHRKGAKNAKESQRLFNRKGAKDAKKKDHGIWKKMESKEKTI
jgi:hypothetical protein